MTRTALVFISLTLCVKICRSSLLFKEAQTSDAAYTEELRGLVEFSAKSTGIWTVSLVIHDESVEESFVQLWHGSVFTVEVFQQPMPGFGVFVFVGNHLPEVLERVMLEGFWDPESHYILLVENASQAHRALEYLWMGHSVWNSFAIAQSNPGVTYTFNPITVRVEEIEVLGNSLSGALLYSKNLKNWNGANFYAVTFRRNTSMIMENNKIGGYEASMLTFICDQLNLTLVIQKTLDKRKYGYKTSNGSYVGSLRNLMEGRANITGNFHFLKVYEIPEIDFTQPVTLDRLCAIVPERGLMPPFMFMFEYGNLVSTSTFIFVYICVGVSLTLFRRVLNGRRIDGLWIEMYRLALGNSVQLVPHSDSEKSVIGITLLMTLFFVNFFQGILMTSMSAPLKFKDIDTMEELKKDNIKVYYGSTDISPIFTEDNYLSKMNFIQSNEFSVNKKNQVGFVTRVNIYEEELGVTDFQNLYTPHIVKQCLVNYYLAYILPKGSAFKEQIDRIIRRVFESGILMKWVQDGLKTHTRGESEDEDESVAEPLSLRDIIPAFWLLSLGLVISFVVFVIEIIYEVLKRSIKLLFMKKEHRRRVPNKPIRIGRFEQ